MSNVIPHGASRFAEPGELCTCGRPAVVVYETTPTGAPVGFCGIANVAPLPAEVGDEDVTAAAVESLNLLHPADRIIAASLLTLWAHRRQLSESERKTVLSFFDVESVPNFDQYSDALYRVDYGEARPGDDEIIERYERLVLNPAHVAYTEAVERRRDEGREVPDGVDGYEIGGRP